MPRPPGGSGSTHRDVAGAAATIRDLLRVELLRGDYAHRPLPDEASLQRTYAASRGAVRAAIELLRDEGLVERLRGAGTFVAARKALHRTNMLSGLGDAAEPVTHEVIGLVRQDAPPVLAGLLRLEPADRVVRLDRQTLVGDDLVAVWTSYLPYPLAAPLNEPAADLSGDYYESLERLLGHPIGHAQVTTEALVADAVTASALGVGRGAPILRMQRLVHLQDGRPLDFGVGRFRGDRVQLSHLSPRRSTAPSP